MEIVIGLLVLAGLSYFLFFRKKEEPVVTPAPYKVETTSAPTPVAEPEVVVVVESAVVPEAVVETAPVAEPVVETAPAKKPRKPRAAKAEAKPAAKKAAPKKAAAIKAKPKATKSKKG